MPPVSRDQQQLVYALRDKYGNKENTPEKHKWVWEKDWVKPIEKKKEIMGKNTMKLKPYKSLYETKTKLQEMPHINTNKITFDLEVEKFNSIEDFLNYLDDIFDGELEIDKYGNKIQLKNRRDKIEFIQGLKDNVMFQNFVNFKLSSSEKKLLDLIMRV